MWNVYMKATIQSRPKRPVFEICQPPPSKMMPQEKNNVKKVVPMRDFLGSLGNNNDYLEQLMK